MLLDSNIILFAARPEYAALRKFIETHSLAVSDISLIEVLGYHNTSDFHWIEEIGLYDPLTEI
jgi:hypothetical protein